MRRGESELTARRMPHTNSFALAQIYIDRVRGDALAARSPTVGAVGRGTKDAIGTSHRGVRDPLASSSERRKLFGQVANVSRRASPAVIRMGSSAVFSTIVGASRRTMSSGPSAAAIFHPTRRSVSVAVAAEVGTHDGGRGHSTAGGEHASPMSPPLPSHDSANDILVSGRLSPSGAHAEAPHTVLDIAPAGDANVAATDAVAASSVPQPGNMPLPAFNAQVDSPECEDVAASDAPDVEVASSTAMGPGDTDLAQLPGSIASARGGADDGGDAGQQLPGVPAREYAREYPTEVPLPSPRANTTSTNTNVGSDADGGFFSSPLGSMHYAAAAPMSIKDRVAKSRRIRPVAISPLPMNGTRRRSSVRAVALEDAVAFGVPAPQLGHPHRTRHRSLGDPSALAPPFGATRGDHAGHAMTPRHSAEKLGGKKSPLDVPELNDPSSPSTLLSHTDSAGPPARPRRRSFGDTQHSLRTDSPPVVFSVPPLREPVMQVLSLSEASETSLPAARAVSGGALAGALRRARPSIDGGSGAPPAGTAAAAYLDATGLTSGRNSTRSSARSQGGGGGWDGDDQDGEEEEEDLPQPATVCAAVTEAAHGVAEAVSVLPFADEAAERDVLRVLRLKMVRRKRIARCRVAAARHRSFPPPLARRCKRRWGTSSLLASASRASASRCPSSSSRRARAAAATQLALNRWSRTSSSLLRPSSPPSSGVARALGQPSRRHSLRAFRSCSPSSWSWATLLAL